MKWFTSPATQLRFHAFWTAFFPVFGVFAFATGLIYAEWLTAVLLIWGLFISHLTALIAARGAEDTVQAMKDDPDVPTD